jgi:hypothetical protein
LTIAGVLFKGKESQVIVFNFQLSTFNFQLNLMMNIKKLLDPAWWIKVQTARPCCIYYFGPFDTAVEAQTDRSGYIEDLENESAQGISATIELCQPRLLTIDCM